MKNRVWSSSPFYFILTLPFLALAAAAWFLGQPLLFYVSLGVFALEILLIFLVNLHFRTHIQMAAKAARQILGGDVCKELDSFPMPVAVIGDKGDIVWYNSSFRVGIGGRKDVLGENIVRFIYPKNVRQVVDGSGVDIAVGEKKFTVYGMHTQKGFVLYFVDDTYYKEINRVYAETRPVVALAHFDNREELVQDSDGSEDARLTSEVESKLTQWAISMGGFLKRINGGRYLILTDESHVRAAAEKRFEILDAVRSVKVDERRRATVSIGIGRGARNLQEAEQWARKALDMALGRGGDQVAMKQKGDTYEFFGGLSKGVEKRDKVRTRVIAATLSDHVRASDAVFIMGHKFSDLDSVGSAVGLWSAVTKALQRSAYVVISRSQSLAQPILSLMDGQGGDQRVFISPEDAREMVTPKSMLIVVDTHSPDFVESPELLDMVSRTVIIDHHRMMVRHIKNAVVFYHEPYASSASEMVAELVQYVEENCLSRREAEALLAGIMLDTKNFTMRTGGRTFEAAAFLRRGGADTGVVKRVFQNDLDGTIARYDIIRNARMYEHNIAIAAVDHEVGRVTAAQAADELLNISGIDTSFILFSSENTVYISARSMSSTNVQVILEQLGGGGNATVAGAQIAEASLEEVTRNLLAAIDRYFENED